jgi:hypothetical protein
MSSIDMVPRTTPASLLAALLVYCAASLVHFVHNAEFLHDYPNMPESLTRSGVYLAWLVVTLVGVVGYLVYRFRAPRVGLALLAVYAALGYAGLDHYVLAPVSAHSIAMNATILFEVVTASILLWTVVTAWRARPATSSF